MMDRFRKNTTTSTTSKNATIARERRVSRHEKELQQRRLLYIGATALGIIALVILLGGAVYQYYLLPRQAVARVNGSEIRKGDYWKMRDLMVRQQIAQLSQQYQQVSTDQQPEIQRRLEELSVEATDIEGAPIASDTLATMVEDQLILQHADEMGIEVTDADMETFISQQFSPIALETPSATQESEPTAAAWATQTAEARLAEATAGAEATSTFMADVMATNAAIMTASPQIQQTVEAQASPTEVAATEAPGSPTAETGAATAAAESPTASNPTPTLIPTNTIGPAEAIATSESTFEMFDRNYLEPANISRGDYKRLIVKPTIARQRLAEQLANAVPTRGEQVHAAHILVASKDAADEVISRINNGEDFATVAQAISTDASTAGSGGDLGWFPRGLMVKPFEDAVFAMDVDQLSEPVQTQFGWHVIKVLEKEADRPIDLVTRRQLQSSAFTNWMRAQQDSSRIWSTVELPELTQQTDPNQDFFMAPPSAPLPPTPTPPPVVTIPPIELEPTATP